MKGKFLCIILIVSTYYTAMSQNGYSVSPQSFDDSYMEDISDVLYFRFEAFMANSSDSTLNINWEIINIDIPTEWRLSVSDKDMSYPPQQETITNNAFPLLYFAGETDIPFNIDVYPNQTAGCGSFDVLISLDESEFILDTIEYMIAVNEEGCITSSTDNQENYTELEISPNPMFDYLNIHAKQSIERITVYNMNGQTLIRELKSFGKLNVSNLDSGAYFLEFVFTKGNREVTKVIKGK